MDLPLKKINNREYMRCLEEIGRLLPIAELGAPVGDRLCVLVTLIKKYEDKNFLFDKPSAIEAIRFRMKEQNLIQKDLIPCIGSKSKVSEVLSGKRRLTIDMIRSLNKNLDIPLELLIQESGENT